MEGQSEGVELRSKKRSDDPPSLRPLSFISTSSPQARRAHKKWKRRSGPDLNSASSDLCFSSTRSSPAFRIQVTVHRPLSWQVSSSSSSSAPLPRKQGRTEGEESRTKETRVSTICLENENGSKNRKEDEKNEGKIEPNPCRRKNERKRSTKSLHTTKSTTSAEESGEEKGLKEERVRRKKQARAKTCELNGVFPVSHSSHANRISGDKKRGNWSKSFDSPHWGRRDASSQPGDSVMTWFKERIKERGMGANGSSSGGPLKSRSQSSSALYSVKGDFGLSNSIPADLWDIPHGANSPASSKKQRNRKNRNTKPILDNILSKKDRDGGKGKKGGAFFALSCPNVAKESEKYDGFGGPPGFPHDQMSSCNHINTRHHQRREADGVYWDDFILKQFPKQALAFFSEGSLFDVRLHRDPRGLGLSITGGIDSQDRYPGLIRIRRVFPLGPAFQSGRLQPWDIILKANGVPLTGLTNHEALEVLRTTPYETILTICRPPCSLRAFLADGPLRKEEPGYEQLEDLNYPPSVSAFNPAAKSKSLSSLKIPPRLSENYGEFEVTLEKVAGSLGFTLRQEDTSVLGHYVRALVKEPALSDGRIQPGDRIISVNSQDLTGMSHAEAINFLRNCPEKVTLRLYRDIAPTPISPLSPTESHKTIKAKPLRQEAIDMLNDIAFRKQMSGSDTTKYSLGGSAIGRSAHRPQRHLPDPKDPATLPRRRPQPTGLTPSPQVISAALDILPLTGFAGGSKEDTEAKEIGRNYASETRSSGSGESQLSTPAGTMSQGKSKSRPADGETKKPSYRQYTLHLDRISSFEDESSDLNHTESIMSEPGFSPKDLGERKFRAGQPAYQSAMLPSKGRVKSIEKQRGAALSDIDIPSSVASSEQNETHREVSGEESSGQRKGGLLKWKGILFSGEGEDPTWSDDERGDSREIEEDEKDSMPLRRSPDGREFRDCDMETPQINGEQLSRRWCSRLGFSLQAGPGGHTFISAIYPDSVAAKDGRLRVGDEVIMVDGEAIREKDTGLVIDTMRKTRGAISITLLRKPQSPDEPPSTNSLGLT